MVLSVICGVLVVAQCFSLVLPSPEFSNDGVWGKFSHPTSLHTVLPSMSTVWVIIVNPFLESSMNKYVIQLINDLFSLTCSPSIYFWPFLSVKFRFFCTFHSSLWHWWASSANDAGKISQPCAKIKYFLLYTKVSSKWPCSQISILKWNFEGNIFRNL